MKRFTCIFLFIVCACFTMGLQTANAEEFPDGWFIGEKNWRWRVNKTTRHAQLMSIPIGCADVIVTIPETVADYDDINYTVTSIHADALEYGRREYEEVTIPNSVTELEPALFSYFEKLKRVNLPSTLKSIGNETFRSCSISDIVLPEGLESVGDKAFCGCDSLTEITLPSSISSIGVECFSHCDILSEVTIKSHLKVLPEGMFTFCGLLTSVILPEGMEEIGKNTFGKCELLTSLSCPQSLWKLGEEAFSGCISIMTLDWGLNITEIGDGCFSGCKLRSVNMPGVRSIGNRAFWDCTLLSDVSMPVVEYIGIAAFDNCVSLRQVMLPNTLRKLDSGAFKDCRNLTSIDLAQVGDIGLGVFDGCDNLKDVIIRNSAVSDFSIVDPFWGCTSIQKLTLGPDVTTLEGFDFEKCTHLMVIECLGATPPNGDYGEYSFSSKTFSENTFAKAALIVPEEAETVYRIHPLWKHFFRDDQPILEASNMSVITGIFNQNWVVRTKNVSGKMETPYVWPSGSNWNHRTEGVSSAFGIGLYDMDLNLVEVVSFSEPLYFASGEAKALHYAQRVGDGVPDGDYLLAPFFGDPQKGTHHISWKWWEEGNNVPVYIYEDTIAFYERLYDCLEITRGEMVSSEPRVGNYEFYSINYVQQGNRPCEYNLYLWINGECVDNITVCLPAHGHWFSRFGFVPKTPGPIKIRITSDRAGRHVKWTDKAFVSVGGGNGGGGDNKPQECSLTLLYPETGSITLPVEKNQQMKLTITAEKGWRVSSVYFDNTDITTDMDRNGHVTTPPISMKSNMAVVYEQKVTDDISPESLYPDIQLLLNGYTATVQNLQPGTIVRVISINGQIMEAAKANSDGKVTFILPSGRVYIINCLTKKFKVRL